MVAHDFYFMYHVLVMQTAIFKNEGSRRFGSIPDFPILCDAYSNILDKNNSLDGTLNL